MLRRDHAPVRILHVFGGLDCGGAETLIMNIYRQLDRHRVQFDFALDAERQGHYEAEIEQLGGRIFHLPHPERAGVRAYAGALLNVLHEHGAFAAVHSHVQHFGGFVMRVARQGQIPVRLAHSHSTHDARPNSWRRGLYRWTMRRMLRRHATHMLGCSRPACEALFGRACWRDSRVSVMPNAINLDRFAECYHDRRTLRKQLGVPTHEPLLLHVGRFTSEKNHRLLIQVFAALTHKMPGAHLALVGDGPLRPEIAALIRHRNLDQSVHLLGIRDDVPELMGAADVFLFPSLYEGLGIAVVEAQAAGLPCVVADTVPAEADVNLGAVRLVALSSAVDRWVEQILAALQMRRPSWSERQQALQAAGYEIPVVAERLERLYLGHNRA